MQAVCSSPQAGQRPHVKLLESELLAVPTPAAILEGVRHHVPPLTGSALLTAACVTAFRVQVQAQEMQAGVQEELPRGEGAPDGWRWLRRRQSVHTVPPPCGALCRCKPFILPVVLPLRLPQVGKLWVEVTTSTKMACLLAVLHTAHTACYIITSVSAPGGQAVH